MTFQELLEKLIESFSSEQARVFLEVVQSIRQEIDIPRMREALARNDIEGAIAALNIEPSAYMDYRVVMETSYKSSGKLAMEHFPRKPGESQIAFRFDMDNPSAEAWLRRRGAERVTEMADEQKQIARDTILEAYSRGAGPDEISLNLAGKINPQTGRRHGGVIGLSEKQRSYSSSLRSRLASGDPYLMRKVLKMSLRDKRYDSTIKKAIAEGKPIPASKISEMALSYENRLLMARAKVIARTEVGMAVMEAQMEAWRQGLSKTGYPEEAVLRRWRHGGGGHDPRIQHIQMSGVEVKGLTEFFEMPDGVRMLHAMDSNGGAKHCANCTCTTDFEIDYSYGVT